MIFLLIFACHNWLPATWLKIEFSSKIVFIYDKKHSFGSKCAHIKIGYIECHQPHDREM